jgi:tetratricopeptide (TPR) repeat protein
MRSPSKLLALSLFLFAAPLFAQTPEAIPSGRVVLVLPFENRSGDASLGWIGDSFPDTLNKRLNSAGFLTISRDDRSFAYDHLGLPVAFRPSRATTIRIAQQLDANFVVIGSYTMPLVPAGTASVQHIDIKAQVLSIDDLRLSPPVEDGAELSRLFDAENAIAWKIARVMDPHFNVAEPTFLAAPGAVPLPAFEDYIRGTNAPSTAERIKRLQASVALAPGYAAALLALGKEQYAARNFDAAAATLGKVPTTDRLALEANFYLGLSRFNTANYDAAARAFEFVATRLPLPEVVNDQAVALSRQGKDATALFQRASLADPSDEDYHYNLAIAFFRSGDTAHALEQAEEALKLKPADNEAIDLRKQLAAVAPGTRLTATALPLTQNPAYSPVERIRRNYSETGFRQAAFQLDQLRAARLSLLPPAQRAADYLQQGHEYFGQGLLPEAETEFQSALEADPNSAAAHAGLAEVRDASGDLEQARAEAKVSLQLHPTAAAWLVMARIELSANQLTDCATDVAHALQLDPTNSAAISLRQYLAQRGQLLP